MFICICMYACTNERGGKKEYDIWCFVSMRAYTENEEYGDDDEQMMNSKTVINICIERKKKKINWKHTV